MLDGIGRFTNFSIFSKVDVRTRAVDVPEQEAITKDNVHSYQCGIILQDI